MKGVHTLIRLAKRSLDELRKRQVVLETQKEKVRQAINKINNELHTEMQLAQKAPEMGTFYGAFAKHIKQKQEKLQVEMANIEKALAAVSEEIMTAFADLKKYEIARDNAIAKAKAEAARKETIMLDEVAATRFTRQQMEEGFTLTEIAVVLVIVAVLAGTVLAGRALIEVASFARVPQEVAEIGKSVHSFKRGHGFLPGDLPAATAASIWPDLCAAAGCEGNGDGKISDGESKTVWRMLKAAGYLESHPEKDLQDEGRTLPSRLVNIAYQFRYESVAGREKHYLIVPSLACERAQVADTKFDDGNPLAGRFSYDPSGDCTLYIETGM